MGQETETPLWKIYERVVGFLQIEEYADLETGVTLNAKVKGVISGIERQVDCLIDVRFDFGAERRIIADAKNYKSKLDINDVERFHAMMMDCGATYGLMFCPSGWSAAAEARASDFIGLKLLDISGEDEYGHEACFEPCRNCSNGVVLHDGQWPILIGNLLSMTMTGKCDVCRAFSVWHWDCGDHIAIPDGIEKICHCGYKWIVEPELDATSGKPVAANLLLDARTPIDDYLSLDEVVEIDRRVGWK